VEVGRNEFGDFAEVRLSADPKPATMEASFPTGHSTNREIRSIPVKSGRRQLCQQADNGKKPESAGT
jgi:hypothetical protein